jgi:hypothetical protein
MLINAASHRASTCRTKERPLLEEKRPLNPLENKRVAWPREARESDHVTEEVLGDFAIAVAAEPERVAIVRDRDNRDDRFREILASIADQQISLGRGRCVDLSHLLDIAINPPIDEVSDRKLRYPYGS